MLQFTNPRSGENDKFSDEMIETVKVQLFGICGYSTWYFFQNKPVPLLWGSRVIPLFGGCCSKIDVGWDFRFFQTQSWTIHPSLNDLCRAPERMHHHSFAYLDKKTVNYSTFFGAWQQVGSNFCPPFCLVCWSPSKSLIIPKKTSVFYRIQTCSPVNGNQARCCQTALNYSSKSVLFCILELLRKDKRGYNAPAGESRLRKSPNEFWYDFN